MAHIECRRPEGEELLGDCVTREYPNHRRRINAHHRFITRGADEVLRSRVDFFSTLSAQRLSVAIQTLRLSGWLPGFADTGSDLGCGVGIHPYRPLTGFATKSVKAAKGAGQCNTPARARSSSVHLAFWHMGISRCAHSICQFSY